MHQGNYFLSDYVNSLKIIQRKYYSVLKASDALVFLSTICSREQKINEGAVMSGKKRQNIWLPFSLQILVQFV